MLKLWQAIGLQSYNEDNAEIIPHNNNQFLQITQSFQENLPQSSIEHYVNISSLKISNQPPTQHRQQQTFMPPQSNNDLSVEIQSCDSEPLDSQQSKVNILQQPNKGRTSSTKTKLSKVVEKLSSISQQILHLKEWAKQSAQIRSAQIQSTMSHYSLISQTLDSQLKQTTKCSKCESTKSIIDNLTKQCWQLEVKCKQQSSELELNNKQMANEEVTIKKVQTCLLLQRGETIIKLKKQVHDLRQENDQLHKLLISKDNQLVNLQNHYKQNLQFLKSQMEQLGEECHVNIHNVIEEKSALQTECFFLRSKCKVAQEQLQSQKLQRTLNKKFLTQYHVVPMDFPTINNDLQTSFSNIRPRRATEKKQQLYRSSQRNGTSILNQSAHLHNEASPKDITRIRTDRQFAPLSKTQQACMPQINPCSALRRGKCREGTKKIKALDVSSSSFDNALIRLEEIHKGIRKQINRSKKSNK